MWSRVISGLAAAVMGVQLGVMVTRRAVAAPAKQPARILVIMDGPQLGQQIASDQLIEDNAPMELTLAEGMPQDLRLLSDAITSLARCRAMESEPQCSTAAHRGWAGRFGVELLDEARAATRDARTRAGLKEASRRANTALRAGDTAERLTGLDDTLRAARCAFGTLQDSL